ncbi:unnamed protein product [Spirodela intermedia]|uniref:Uncharacterized protein n=1 Tax=Spirodela intermedia TaxID=51605 RepID=A0A7I8ILI0_SPIIN|nr:unnamed protein product [Spirodela intermedia]CAA6657801.1 unnamed protein product [Spirodela intermedia]
MEESEKRKERLRAMRVEAAQSEISADQLGSPPMHLFNPLAQASGAPPSAGRAAPPARFDYYTDPMSAYSGNRSSARGHHPPDNFASPIRSCSPTAHPASPSSDDPKSCSGNQFQLNYSSHQISYGTSLPIPQYGPWRSPVGMAGPFPRHNPLGVPPMQYGSGNAYGRGPPHSVSRGIIGASPGFGQVASPRAYAGGGSPGSQYGRVSPGANFGRGGGGGWRPGNYSNTSAGRGGRGRGANEAVSARERPELFGHKMMVMDPWDELKPVVGCILMLPPKQMTSDSLNSWLPSSIRAKKAKFEETISVPRSQVSLAQSIALAFEEAAREEGS